MEEVSIVAYQGATGEDIKLKKPYCGNLIEIQRRLGSGWQNSNLFVKSTNIVIGSRIILKNIARCFCLV